MTFVATLSDGAMRGKRAHIAAYPADFETYAEVVAGDLKVHVYTRDVAVATGLYTATLRHPEGSEKSQQFRFTDTWPRATEFPPANRIREGPTKAIVIQTQCL